MSKVIRGAGILAIFAIIAKLIGALYRIPLTNIVGAEGIGLYQMVFPLYTVLLTISSGGLPVAISKVVSAKIANKDEVGARRVLKISLVSLTIIGSIAFLLIVIFREKIAFIQGNPKAALPYLGIAPSLIFVAIIACFRGYFQGLQNMVPSGISQLFEQIFKLAIGLTLAKLMQPRGVEFAVLGAVLGVSLSELIAAIGLVGNFIYVNSKFRKRTRISLAYSIESAADFTLGMNGNLPQSRTRDILKEIYKIALPVTLGSLVLPITQVIDSILVINMLVAANTSIQSATSLFGLVNGPINTLINMPIVISLSISIALLPKVSENVARKESVENVLGMGVKYTFYISLIGFLALGIFSRSLLSSLYSSVLSPSQIDIGAKLLSLGSLSIIYVGFLQVATAVLQGHDKAHIPAINLLIGAVVKVVSTLVLLPRMGIAGAMIATVLCYIVTCFLDVIAMRKCSRTNLGFCEFFLSPLIAGGGFALSSTSSYSLIKPFMGGIVGLITAMVIGGIVYVALLALTKGIKKDEMQSFNIFKKAKKKPVVEEK